LAAFRQAGLIISFDYGERLASNLVEKNINLVDIAFVSLPGHSIPEAENLARQLSGRGPELAVVTLGKRGSLAYDGQVYYQPSLPTAPVDTLGAGDTFIANFLAGWIKGKTRPEALSDAALAAAQTCTHLGAWLQETQLL
jgi:fructoselysine 6-kinase